MLLQNQALSPEARKHFALPRNPFVDDVQGVDDVYQSKSVRYVRATLLDAALHHGFVAIVGESGAGKSTLPKTWRSASRPTSATCWWCGPTCWRWRPPTPRARR